MLAMGDLSLYVSDEWKKQIPILRKKILLRNNIYVAFRRYNNACMFVI
jgi:hypothetical protein